MYCFCLLSITVMIHLSGHVPCLTSHATIFQLYMSDTFVPCQYFRINMLSGLLNRPSVRTWLLVPTLFVWTSEISGLSEPRLTNLHCIIVTTTFEL